MTDLHTHILPGMDDGAKTLEESLLLLEMERQQGVDTVVLTPHFYADRETVESFLRRRDAAAARLVQAVGEKQPRMILGAEVAWFPSLAELPQLKQLCLGSSRYLLLELPYAPWSRQLVDNVYRFACGSGVIPILAHVERYLPLQKPDQVEQLLALGLPMQMSADVLCQRLKQKKMARLLSRGEWYIGSDCHDQQSRKPNMAQAEKFLCRHFGGYAREMLDFIPV